MQISDISLEVLVGWIFKMGYKWIQVLQLGYASKISMRKLEGILKSGYIIIILFEIKLVCEFTTSIFCNVNINVNMCMQ